MRRVTAILTGMLVLSVALNVYQWRRGRRLVIVDNRIDTIVHHRTVARDSVVTRYVTERLRTVCRDTVRDTLRYACGDSVEVEIPIEQKTYGDSTYRAWVSGYRARLDSIMILRRTDVVREPLPDADSRTRRWSVGIGAGCGLTPRGVQPYVGVSVHYSLLGF